MAMLRALMARICGRREPGTEPEGSKQALRHLVRVKA